MLQKTKHNFFFVEASLETFKVSQLPFLRKIYFNVPVAEARTKTFFLGLLSVLVAENKTQFPSVEAWVKAFVLHLSGKTTRNFLLVEAESEDVCLRPVCQCGRKTNHNFPF